LVTPSGIMLVQQLSLVIVLQCT